MNCEVCVLPFTSKLRPEKKCNFCAKSSCLNCIKTYIMLAPIDPHCLHCRRSYSEEIIDGMFSRHYRESELRKHRIQVLIEQEKSLFADTMIIIEREDVEQQYTAAYTRHRTLLGALLPEDTVPIDKNTIDKINAERQTMKECSEKVQILIHSKSENKKHFIKKCPSCETGYLSTQWKCQSCETKVCNKCNTILEEEHECKQEDIDSIKLIEKETKPCPHCGIRVHKIEGCNQMWCTACNNAFDWRTGLKVSGQIHNPHFQEYQQRNPQLANHQWQNMCEGNNDPGNWPFGYGHQVVRMLQSKLSSTLQLSQAQIDKIYSINRLLIERSVFVTAYVGYGPQSYVDLRKKRLRGTIDDAQWATLLSVKETKRQKSNKTRQLDELLLAICRDIFYAFLDGPLKTVEQFQRLFLDPLEAARLYYNENCLITKTINENWYINF